LQLALLALIETQGGGLFPVYMERGSAPTLLGENAPATSVEEESKSLKTQKKVSALSGIVDNEGNLSNRQHQGESR